MSASSYWPRKTINDPTTCFIRRWRIHFNQHGTPTKNERPFGPKAGGGVINLHHYLTVSAILFSIGLVGIFTRKNILMILLSIELILNAANLSFVSFSSFLGDLAGQVVVFFTMIVSAVEVTVGLVIVVLLFRKKETTHIDELNTLKW